MHMTSRTFIILPAKGKSLKTIDAIDIALRYSSTNYTKLLADSRCSGRRCRG
jgi:hypothetical protein